MLKAMTQSSTSEDSPSPVMKISGDSVMDTFSQAVSVAATLYGLAMYLNYVGVKQATARRYHGLSELSRVLERVVLDAVSAKPGKHAGDVVNPLTENVALWFGGSPQPSAYVSKDLIGGESAVLMLDMDNDDIKALADADVAGMGILPSLFALNRFPIPYFLIQPDDAQLKVLANAIYEGLVLPYLAAKSTQLSTNYFSEAHDWASQPIASGRPDRLTSHLQAWFSQLRQQIQPNKITQLKNNVVPIWNRFQNITKDIVYSWLKQHVKFHRKLAKHNIHEIVSSLEPLGAIKFVYSKLSDKLEGPKFSDDAYNMLGCKLCVSDLGLDLVYEVDVFKGVIVFDDDHEKPDDILTKFDDYIVRNSGTMLGGGKKYLSSVLLTNGRRLLVLYAMRSTMDRKGPGPEKSIIDNCKDELERRGYEYIKAYARRI